MHNIVPLISALFILLAFFMQIFGLNKENKERKFSKEIIGKVFLFCSVSFIIGYYFWIVIAQYFAWKSAGPPASFLVPPYLGIGYVFYYHFMRFLLFYCFSALVAVAVFFGGTYLNKRARGCFFEPDELYFAALAIFLLGYPAWNYLWIHYVACVFLLAVVFSIIQRIHSRSGKERTSLYLFWLPLAIIGILIKLVVVSF